MSGETRTIQVTEEEYQLLMRLREQLHRQRAAAERLSQLPGGKRGTEFTMGAVAGMAAYWLYQELFQDEEGTAGKAPPKPPRRPSKKGEGGEG